MKQGEPKPHSFCKTPEEKCTINYCDINVCQNRKRELVELQEQFKQETIEEVAERVTEEWFKNNCYAKELFIKGAKWQQEQILDFLYKEITERRDYSASKMCEVVIDYIKQNK